MRFGLGLALGRHRGNASPAIITADTSPVLAALDDADTPATGFTSGTYSSTAGTISTETAVYLVDGAPQLGTFDLTAGEIVQVREDVVDSAANERSFYTGSQIVQPSVALSNTAVPTIDQAIIGSVSTATTGTWAGSAARAYSYQWKVDGSNVGTDTNTYTPQVADDGLDLTVTVTADDGFTQVAATSAATTVAVAVPVLSSPTTTVNGQESITGIGVDTTIGSGTLSWGVFDAATTPNAATIIAGTGSPAYGNQTVSTTGTQSVSDQIGLSAASDYKTWFVHDGSAVVGTALYWTWPDVLGTGGTLTFSASDNGGDVDLIVYKDASPIYTGTLTQAQYQAEEFLLVAPVISGTAGVGEVLTRDSAALWLWDATSGNSVSAIWQKDGVDIPLETGTTYTTVAGDAGADITYKETLGASTSSSNAISIPAASFVPTDLADLVAWYDASDTSTITHSGGEVSQFNDKGPNGYNLIQGVAARRWTTGSATENVDMNVMLADGLGDLMFYGSNVINYDNHEMYFVFRPDITTFDVYGSGSTSSGHVLVLPDAGTLRHVLATSAGLEVVNGPTFSVNEFLINHVYVDGTTIACGKNGVVNTTTLAGTKGSLTLPMNVGARTAGHSPAFSGNMCEVVICDAALSLADKNSLGNYLANKWGLTWTTMT